MRHTGAFSIVLTAALLSSCNLAPKYHRPEMPIPQAYKEAPGQWQQAAPQAADADRGPWWKVYGDATLDTLEAKVTSANQDLKAAVARYDEARAAADVTRADYFPQVNANADAMRERYSTTIAEVRESKPFNDVLAAGSFSYELDIWGRVRNAVKASESQAKASAADLATIDLSLHAELAMDYFSLRGLDAQQVLVNETVVDYEKALKLTQSRHTGGAAPEVDVDRAQAQLESARTLAADTSLKRSQLEHTIAVLDGEIPSAFTLAAETKLTATPPVTPILPAALLEQRPDIAAAALRVEAANAQIGVARAAYFPTISLGAEGGIESAMLSKIIGAPSLLWSLGPSLVTPIFDGGRIAALSDEAHAAYEESVANYRSTVLAAFQQVEDNLAALRQLTREDTTETAAVEAAKRTLRQAGDRYSGGIATYLDVVDAQTTALNSELSLIDIRTRHLNASVMLIKALGGGYQAAGPVIPAASPPATSKAEASPLSLAPPKTTSPQN